MTALPKKLLGGRLINCEWCWSHFHWFICVRPNIDTSPVLELGVVFAPCYLLSKIDPVTIWGQFLIEVEAKV
jgi:hypothetical protein